MQVHMKWRESDWKKVEQPKKPQKFVAIEAYENRLLLAAKRSVVVFDFSENLENLIYTMEIDIVQLGPELCKGLDYLRSIHALSLNEVVVCDANGLCLELDLTRREVISCYHIPKSIEPWTTSAAKVEDFRLFGDRVGNLFLYKSEKCTSTASLPIQKLWKLHGRLGVTTISVEHEQVITTGNDGTVKTLFLDRASNPVTIEIHRSERTLINWIEKVCSWNGKKYLLGFNDNYFGIAHNRQIIYEHNCGGRHRNWDVVLADNDRKVHFTYIQKRQLHVVEFLLSDFNLVNDDVSWHTLDCNAMAAVCDERLLISGGEDTMMKLTRLTFNAGTAELREFASINSHISSIKAIATWQEDNDLFIFSAGGRAQIVVTRIIRMKVIKEEVNHMLTNSSQNGNSKESTIDAETKFTSLCYENQSRRLFVACSDGFIRIFKFSKSENYYNLTLLTEHFYGKCILKIYSFENCVLTMATDGFVVFWNTSDDFQIISKLKHNQSGINCCDVFKREDGCFVLATSGDDTGIFITTFHFLNDEVRFLKTISSYDVHIAQVTGLKFTSENELCTTSIDQTICKLQIKDSTIRVVSRFFTCISDVKGFLLLNNSQTVAIYGAGLEILQMKNE